MPPRGHSHTSHSSSSRSSHSSSRSSSRSSSFSSSSSRSSSGSSFGNYGSGWRGSARPASASYRPSRTRTNQPTGYTSSGGSASSFFRCHTHDYVYYPTSWTDPDTGNYYHKGYYDEEGRYYDKIVTKKSGHYETKYSCEYCGSDVNLKWDEGQQPRCPNCGAALTSSREWVVDEIEEETTQYLPREKSGSLSKTLTAIVIIVAMAFFSAKFISTRFGNNDQGARTETAVSADNYTDGYDDTIYVNSIGRNVYWNDAYDSYYDRDTDCYLVYNDELDPPVWQYWYEGISSDYGDYGWMEWDYEENCWYIESESGWDKLPGKYNDAERLWHF